MTPACLALFDGTLFEGVSVGWHGQACGDVVFNTAMTGYQEVLSDPSYAGQLLTFTYPHIGNYGVSDDDNESRAVFAAGLILRDLPICHSHFRARTGLRAYLHRHRVVAISDIDTRCLTRLLRDKGTQPGCIVTGDAGAAAAIQGARDFARAPPKDWLPHVSCAEIYRLGNRQENADHVLVYDFGVKQQMLRLLSAHGCRITVVPATTCVDTVIGLMPDGVLLSNGPGNPSHYTEAITAVRQLLACKIPLFGICLGHQLLGLALGSTTSAMRFGHHGANHPVLDLDTQRVWITSQNHGFQLDEADLPVGCRVTYRSLFDGSVQGIALTDPPAFSFQGHPEASPGPHDMGYLFDRFIDLMRRWSRR